MKKKKSRKHRIRIGGLLKKYRGYDFIKKNALNEVDIFHKGHYQATGDTLNEAIRITDFIEGNWK